MSVQLIMMGRIFIIFMENILEIYQKKYKDQTEQKNGQIYGIFLNQRDLIKRWQRWIQKKERIEEKLMVQYKQCRNSQNGMKSNNHPYKLQFINETNNYRKMEMFQMWIYKVI